MKKNEFLIKSAFGVLALFVLVTLSACTMNNDTNEVKPANDSQNNTMNDDNLDQDNERIDSPLTKNNWLWTESVKNQVIIEPKQKEAFVIMFNEDMSVNGTTDCNNYFGDYKLDEQKLSFGPLASTMMYCEDSQEAEFIQSLGEVSSYAFTEDGEYLTLNLDGPGDVMRFKKTDSSGEEEEAL